MKGLLHCSIPLIALFIAIPSGMLHAQKIDWNVDFAYLFDNSEFDRSHNLSDHSGTLNAARLTPRIGIFLPQSTNVHHRLMLGVDLYKDMGTGRKLQEEIGELSCYYRLDATFRNDGEFTAVAGCYPRKLTDGKYRGAFFDEAYLFEDNNLEGLLFKYSCRRIQAELGLDWMGKYAEESNPQRRERFSIFTHGTWDFAGPFSLGWTGSFYHYACSRVQSNVIDNHTVFPYISFNPRISALDRMSLEIGPLAAYQRDRSIDKTPQIPIGLQFDAEMVWKGLSINNWFYCGKDMQPYHSLGETDLYPGESAYHIISGPAGWIDCFAVGYTKKIGEIAVFSAGAAFHFGNGFMMGEEWIGAYRGCQQFISVKFNIGARHPKPKYRFKTSRTTRA